jgi:hypothetical protein
MNGIVSNLYDYDDDDDDDDDFINHQHSISTIASQHHHLYHINSQNLSLINTQQRLYHLTNALIVLLGHDIGS